MTPYRVPPEPPRQPRRATWRRILRAWASGTLDRAEHRRFRNHVLRDPDAAVAEAGSLAELFRVGLVLVQHNPAAAPPV